MKQWSPDLYHAKFSSEICSPLGLAAEAGFTDFAEDILALGFSKLLEVQSNEGWCPVQGAVEREKFGTAAFLLKKMTKKRYRMSYPFKIAE